jgi:hypothetical protein
VWLLLLIMEVRIRVFEGVWYFLPFCLPYVLDTLV